MAKRRVSNGKIFVYVTLFVSLIFALFWFTGFSLRKNHELKEQAQKQNQFAAYVASEKRKNTPLTLPILIYHYVEVVTDLRDTIRQSLAIRPKVFREQLSTLQKHGYTPILLSDLIKYFKAESALPEKPVILTFDDGYSDFYTDVLPILRQFRLPAVLYVVSGFLDTTKNYLTASQLLEIKNSGLVEIGAHSITHRDLSFIALEHAIFEMKQSKRELEQLLRIPVIHFAYPFGSYSEKLTVAAAHAGFKTAATVDRGITQSYSERYKLKRIRPGNLTGDEFLRLLSP